MYGPLIGFATQMSVIHSTSSTDLGKGGYKKVRNLHAAAVEILSRAFPSLLDAQDPVLAIKHQAGAHDILAVLIHAVHPFGLGI